MLLLQRVVKTAFVLSTCCETDVGIYAFLTSMYIHTNILKPTFFSWRWLDLQNSTYYNSLKRSLQT